MDLDLNCLSINIKSALVDIKNSRSIIIIMELVFHVVDDETTFADCRIASEYQLYVTLIFRVYCDVT